MLILNAAEVRAALPMQATIAGMKRAYAALSSGKATVPLRTRLPIANLAALSLFMPAHVQMDAGDALAVKIVSLFPGNPARGLAYIQAAVLVLDAETGRALAILEGSALTAIRTGAGSGAAIDLLARPDSRVAAIFGAGAQGRTQLEAACTTRQIESVFVFDQNRAQAEKFAAEMRGQGPIPANIHIAASAQEAVAEADIICTATTSTTPVFADKDLKPGVHISGIGSYTPDMQEVPAETIARARVVVDSRATVMDEAGDIVQAIRAGVFAETRVHAELGEIVLGQKPGRQSATEITYFKSVGNAVQDAVASQLALENARMLKLGKEVEF